MNNCKNVKVRKKKPDIMKKWNEKKWKMKVWKNVKKEKTNTDRQTDWLIVEKWKIVNNINYKIEKKYEKLKNMTDWLLTDWLPVTNCYVDRRFIFLSL